MPGPYQSFDDRERYVQQQNEDSGLTAFGSKGEGFWTSLGMMELGKQGYITVPEFLASGIGGTGLPDGVAYQLGEHQEILAELGFLPGGAPLPEIALRSCFDIRSPTELSTGIRVAAIEGKSDGKGADGRRQLASHRRNGDPYLASEPVDGGWLFCPRDHGRLSRLEEIGAISWDDDGPAVRQAPVSSDVDEMARDREARQATALVLDQVLRYQPLDTPLTQAVRDCLDNPERLHHYLD